MKANYHTHTDYCPHAVGNAEAYVQKAIQAGYDALGFSDHCPWPQEALGVPDMRMTAEDFPRYVQELRGLREKYAGQISIRIGLECEYFPAYMDWLRRLIDEAALDYVIFGNHYYKTEGNERYMGQIIQRNDGFAKFLESALGGMESGLFAYMAHPEVFMRGYPAYDEHCEAAFRTVCRRAAELGMPLEYNLLGVRYNQLSGKECYPHHAFWEIAAQEGCQAIVGVDAHDPEDLLLQDVAWQEARDYLRGLGLTVLDSIDLRR